MMTSERVIVDPNGRQYSQYSRDSFDRFGDDLVELILSYLSLEDKVMLQCVAKQWTRTVFIRQTQLSIYVYQKSMKNRFIVDLYWNDSDRNSILININDDSVEHRYHRYHRLKTLLDKCLNVRSITLRSDHIERSLLDTIAECLPKFGSLCIHGRDWSEASIQHLDQTLGIKVKKITLAEHSETSNELLETCPNIETLICFNFSLLCNKELLSSLTSLDIAINACNASLFSKFCLKYGKQLKRLKLSTVHNTSSDGILSDQLVNIVENVSLLESIECLDLIVFRVITDKNEIYINIVNELQRMANKCKKLRTFRLIMPFSVKFIGNVWHSFGQFEALRQLDIEIEVKDSSHSMTHSMNAIKNLKALHISSHKIGDPFFKHVNKWGPNLTKLELITRCDLSDSLLRYVSALKHLLHLTLRRLRDSLNNLTDSGFISLLDNCSQLNTINLSFRTSTVKFLYSKAP